jgi:ketosteroid isomerase-like protein
MSATMDTELLALEQRRCEALGSRDVETLRALLTEHYLHVHTGGNTEDREQWLTALGAAFERSSERERLEVRFLVEDVALMSGVIRTTGRAGPEDPRVRVTGFATQTWVRQDGTWQLAHFHVTATGAVETLVDHV